MNVMLLLPEVLRCFDGDRAMLKPEADHRLQQPDRQLLGVGIPGVVQVVLGLEAVVVQAAEMERGVYDLCGLAPEPRRSGGGGGVRYSVIGFLVMKESSVLRV